MAVAINGGKTTLGDTSETTLTFIAPVADFSGLATLIVDVVTAPSGIKIGEDSATLGSNHYDYPEESRMFLPLFFRNGQASFKVKGANNDVIAHSWA